MGNDSASTSIYKSPKNSFALSCFSLFSFKKHTSLLISRISPWQKLKGIKALNFITMEVKKNLSTETTTPTGDGSLYDLSFFDPRFSDYRKQLIGLLFYPLVYISLLMWGCLSLYYGSLYWNNNLSKTSVFAVDLDGGLLGQQIIAGIKASQANTPAGLHWRFDAAINETALSRETVLDEQAWAVLESKATISSCHSFNAFGGNVNIRSLPECLCEPRPRSRIWLTVL